MTGYLHYNQGAAHFCSQDLSIRPRQCQSLHAGARLDGEGWRRGRKIILFAHFLIITVTQRQLEWRERGVVVKQTCPNSIAELLLEVIAQQRRLRNCHRPPRPPVPLPTRAPLFIYLSCCVILHLLRRYLSKTTKAQSWEGLEKEMTGFCFFSPAY